LGFVCIAAVLNGPWNEEKKNDDKQGASNSTPVISEDFIVRYERLRSRMMQHAQMPGLEGAAILMRRGMLVWIRTCEGDSVLRESVSCFRADSKPLPLELQNAAVSLLSNMILENHQRRRSHDDIPGKGYIHTSRA